MKNLRQMGDAIYVPAPSGGVVSGQFVVVGSLFGVAGYDAAQGVVVPLWNKGVFSLPKTTSEVWTPGQKLYWVTGTGKVSSTAGANLLIGVACALPPGYTAAAGNGATVGDVRLNPSF